MTTFETGQAQAPQNPNFAPLTPDKKSGFTRSQKVIAGIAGGTILGGGALFGIYKGVESGTQKAIENRAGADRVATAPIVPGTNHEVMAEGVEMRQEDQVLDAMRADSLQELKDKGYNLNPGIPSDENTNKEIADQFTVNIHSAWKLAKTDPIAAEQVLANIIDPTGPSNDDYIRYEQELDNPAGIVTAAAEVTDWTKNFRNSDFRDVKSNGNTTRVLTIQYTDETMTQNTFRRTSDNGAWQLVKMVPAFMEENDYVPDLREIDKVVS